MAGSGVTRAATNKKIRQEALREQLAAKGLAQQVIDSAEKLADLDGKKSVKNKDMEQIHVQRLKAANDARLALLKKYLPDLTAVHQTNDAEAKTIDEWLNELPETKSPEPEK